MSEYSLSSVTDLLFVYGTLKQGCRNEVADRLHRDNTFIGNGWFPGRLYQIDWFPGAVYDPAAKTRVWGELYRLHQPATELAYLDQYEGLADSPALFIRRVVPVTANSKPVACHTYLYQLPTVGKTPIESGHFCVSD